MSVFSTPVSQQELRNSGRPFDGLVVWLTMKKSRCWGMTDLLTLNPEARGNRKPVLQRGSHESNPV